MNLYNNQFKTVALLGLLSALLMTISYSLVGGPGGIFLGLVLAAVTNLGSWYYSDKIALAAYRSQCCTCTLQVPTSLQGPLKLGDS